MNCFYDILINLNDNRVFRFYEWSKKDPIIHIKKIPIFKIKTKDFKILASCNILVQKDFLDSIYKVTESYEKDNKYIDYIALFTDENNSIVLEFNSNGESISRSMLLLDEELDLLEIAHSLKSSSIEYQIINKINQGNTLRQIDELNRILEIEIKTLYKEKNFLKLRYLYNEVVGIDDNNIDKIYNKLLNIINSDLNDDHLKLYNIIKLSYKHLST